MGMGWNRGGKVSEEGEKEMITKGRVRVWKDQVVPYVRTVAGRSAWKVTALGFDEEDLLHEAFFVYERCLTNYGTVLTKEGKLTPLFRGAINNFIYDLAAEATKKGSYVG